MIAPVLWWVSWEEHESPCGAHVVLPELAVQAGLTPACWPCLRGAMADARHMGVSQ